MAVPDYQSLMLPLLVYAGGRKTEVSTAEVVKALAEVLKLTEDDLNELLPSGIQSTFVNRVHWAATYLKKAGLLQPTRRKYYQITDQGRSLLSTKPALINVQALKNYPTFVEFQSKKGTRRTSKNEETEIAPELSFTTPSEALEDAYQSLRNDLADDLLEKLKTVSPAFFEQCVVELLVKMGYGGSRSDAGRAIGRSGDGGIDGIIKEDKLGLDVIYIQAKRWGTNSVGRPDIQQFAGALQGQRANKGIFITTSRFTEDAKGFVAQIGSKIVLIDGEQLAQLMIDHDVGVSTAATYQVKRIDSDYFNEES
jgi:restriction system protein